MSRQWTPQRDELVCHCGHFIGMHAGGLFGPWQCSQCECDDFTEELTGVLDYGETE